MNCGQGHDKAADANLGLLLKGQTTAYDPHALGGAQRGPENGHSESERKLKSRRTVASGNRHQLGELRLDRQDAPRVTKRGWTYPSTTYSTLYSHINVASSSTAKRRNKTQPGVNKPWPTQGHHEQDTTDLV